MSTAIYARVTLTSALLAFSYPSFADHVEEVVVSGDEQTFAFDATSQVLASTDSTQLLKKVPGGNINGNGPLTRIPQYRGMYGPRVSVDINGFQLSPAGPNWMDPPLSYVASAHLEKFEVYRGMAPVSVAQEAIGGAIKATTWQGGFADQGSNKISGRVAAAGQTANAAGMFSAATTLANAHNRLSLSYALDDADDTEFADGDILPTEYKRQQYEIGYGFKQAHHRFNLAYKRNETDDTGTPALPMDIQYIDGDLYNAAYTYQEGNTTVSVKAFSNELDHGMTNFHLRSAPGNPMMWRRNIAISNNAGADLRLTLGATQKQWIIGVDYFEEEHQSDISNPNNGSFFVQNFNDAERSIYGAYAEYRRDIDNRWLTEAGVRVNHVKTDAGAVDATPAQMMAAAGALRDSFNNADRSQNDTNTDIVAKLWYKTDGGDYYIGVGQKTRSPSYIERYLWLPLQATGGLADGLVYTGNIDLDPETAREIELGVDFEGNRWQMSPRMYYRKVDDYIQGTPSTVMPAVMFVNMMNMMNGTSTPAPLQFNNVDAVFWGFDTDWQYELNDNWRLGGIISLVRGERDDIDDDLYRISPDNASIALSYIAKSWEVSAETVAYATQNRVSKTNNEQKTDGYQIANLTGIWQVSSDVVLSGGINNLFDKNYQEHTGGYNRASNPDIATGARLPGIGRNAFIKLNYSF